MSTRRSSWFIFFGCLLLLSLSATSYGLVADRLFIALRFTLMLWLSALLLKDRLVPDHRKGYTLFARLRQWARGEAATDLTRPPQLP